MNITFPGVETSLSTCTIKGTATQNIIFNLSGKRRILSTRDGFRDVTAVAENCCPVKLWKFAHRNPQEFRRTIYTSIGKTKAECAFLYTGADIEQGVFKVESDKVMIFITADVRTNAMRVGMDVPLGKRAHRDQGTINIFLFTGATLSEGAMTRCLITLTEAKCSALQDLAVKSSYSQHLIASGTGTDNIIVVPGTGKKVDLLRGHSELSLLIGRTAVPAIKDALLKGLKPEE